MADLRIRINELPEERTPAAIDNIAIDGPTTRRTSLKAAADAVRPYSTEGQAREGHDDASTMTPVRVSQAIETLGGQRFATSQQGNKADTAAQKSDLSSVATTGSYHDLKDQPALGSAAAKDASAFATAVQGRKADTAVQPAEMQKLLDAKLDKKGGHIEGDLSVNGNINLEGNALTIGNGIYAGASLNITGKILGWGSGKTLEIDTATGDISGSAWGNGKLSDYLKKNIVQPKDLGTLARKDKVAVSDIDAQGTPSEKLFLSGDGKWKEPPVGGLIGNEIKGNLNISKQGDASGEVNADGCVAANYFSAFNVGEDGSKVINGTFIYGGDIDGLLWNGRLSNYLKEHIPKAYAIIDKDNKVVSIADGLHNIEVAGMRVVGIPEEANEWEVKPIGFDTEQSDVEGGDIEEAFPDAPFFPDLINWRFHAAIDLEKGLRDRIDAAISRMPASKQAVNRAKLARKTMFQRHDPLFEELLADPKFGMNEDQFDTFWKNATILN